MGMVEESTIVGFKVMLTTTGNLVFESTLFPEEQINTVFKRESDRKLIHALLRVYERETKDVDKKLQQELTAILNMP
jgi:hypothetical protein